MERITEVSVYTIGNSEKTSTWSNLPYFLCESLISKGIKVNRINLNHSAKVEKIYNMLFLKIIYKIYPNTNYSYFRSIFNYIHQRQKIKKAIIKYPQSDIHLFLTFSFSGIGLTNKSIIHLCDWNFDYYLKHFKEKTPDFFENLAIKREKNIIEKADMVFSTYENVKIFLLNNYLNTKIFTVQKAIINLNEETISNINIDKKQNNLSILFIGGLHYKESLLILIKAVQMLLNDFNYIKINVIGMNHKDIEGNYPFVNFNGYLNKDKIDEFQLYIDLIKNATLFVNTSPKLGTTGSMLEAMYFKTPVIISPCPAYIELFGNTINFGLFEENDPVRLSGSIKKIILSNDYSILCENAHFAVKDFTWDNYVTSMIKIITNNA